MSSKLRKVNICLPYGEVSALSCDGLIHARGVRYARAARFHKPEPATTWIGVQDCTGPAPLCPQNPSPMTPVMGDIEAGHIQDEDCLRVSIVAPEAASAAPVMVFLHGGAFLTGGGDVEAYKPLGLARRGVVAVNVTYRLGLLGYLAIPGVAPANLGLLDQIQALRWVQDNIGAFGGDPMNVTVIGQSAGADSIFCLLVTDDARRLFRRAILQSGPVGRMDEDAVDMTVAMSAHASRLLSGQDPQAIPIASILELQSELLEVGRYAAPHLLLQYAPAYGEYPLPPRKQLLRLFMAAARDTPILIGHTASEDTAFRFMDPGSNPTYLLWLFEGAVSHLVDQVDKEMGIRLPRYTMAWHPEGSALKATHCIDLPLLLGEYPAWKDALMLQGPETQYVMEKLGDSVKNLWVAFANGHDLNGRHVVIDAKFQFP